MPPESAHTKSSCDCGCGKPVTAKTARAHRRGKAPILLRAAAAAIQKAFRRPQNPIPGPVVAHIGRQSAEPRADGDPRTAGVGVNRHDAPAPAQCCDPPLAAMEGSTGTLVSLHHCGYIACNPHAHNLLSAEDVFMPDVIQTHVEDPHAAIPPAAPDEFLQAATHAIQQRIWQGRPRTTVEDDVDEDEPGLGAEPLGDDIQEALFEAHDARAADGEDVPEFEAISAWDKLAEILLRAGMTSGA